MSRWGSGSCWCHPRRRGRSAKASGVSSLAEDEGEQRGEGEVDEVGRLDQADGQEELTLQLSPRLGLPGDAADQRVTGDAVTDTGTDRAAAESQPAADETATGGAGLRHVLCCHVRLSPSRTGGRPS